MWVDPFDGTHPDAHGDDYSGEYDGPDDRYNAQAEHAPCNLPTHPIPLIDELLKAVQR